MSQGPQTRAITLLDTMHHEDQVRLLIAALINQEVPVLPETVEMWQPLMMGGFVQRTSPGHVEVSAVGRMAIMQMADRYVLSAPMNG